MTKHELISLACMVRESRSLLPCSSEVDDASLKTMLDAAEKSVRELYDYLNNRIAGESLLLMQQFTIVVDDV